MPYTYIPNLRPLYPRDASREVDAVYVAERPDHANTPATGFGEIWLESGDSPPSLYYTDEAGADKRIMTGPTKAGTATSSIPYFATTDTLAVSVSYTFDAGLKLATAGHALHMTEAAALVTTPAAGRGYFWVRDDAPTAAMFTNDISEDLQLLGDPIPIGSWNFNIVNAGGTPATGQFNANNTLFTATTNIRLTATGTIEGWSRGWLDELPAPGYIVMRKKGAPTEEVIFSYSALADVGGTWSDITVAYSSDTTADTNWATDDEWTLYVHSTPAANTLDAIITSGSADNDVNVPVANPVILRNNAASLIPLKVESTNSSNVALDVLTSSATTAPLRVGDGTDQGFLGPRILKMKEGSAAPVINGAGEASIWIRDDAPNSLIFQNDDDDLIVVSAVVFEFNGFWDGTGVASVWYKNTASTGSSNLTTAVQNDWNTIGNASYFHNGGRIVSAHYAMFSSTAAAGGGQDMEWVLASQNVADGATSAGAVTQHVSITENYNAIEAQTGAATIDDATIAAGDQILGYVRQTNASMTGGADIRGAITLLVEIYE
jgi:hypothetical protein